MGISDFARVTVRATREHGVRHGAYTFARETWHSWQRLYGNGEAVHRLKWYLPHDNPTIGARCYTAEIPATNFSEYHVADVFEEKYLVHDFLRFVKPDDVFWDAGANVGLWTLLVAQAAGETVAFEPDERVLQHLVENVGHNGLHPKIFGIGLGEVDEIVSAEVNHRWGVESVAMRLRRADDLIDEGNPVPDVVKMDIEGAELQALRGFGDYLGEVRHLLIEIHPQFLGDGDEQRIVDVLSPTHTVERVNDRGDEYHIEARLR